MIEFAHDLLAIDLDTKDMNALQVSARAFVVFAATLALVRFSDKRFLSRMTAFDAVLGFMFAAILARAVNGSAPLLPSIAAAFVLVLMHRLLAFVTSRSDKVGGLIKGHYQKLIDNGQIVAETMRKAHLSNEDVLEALRLEGVTKLEEVECAYMERNGQVSVIKKAG